MSRAFSTNCGSLDSLKVSLLRLQPESLPNPLNGYVAQPTSLGHRARAPVRGIARHRLQRAHDDRLDLLVLDLARCSAARFIEQALDPVAHKPAAPFANHLLADVPPSSHHS